MQASSLGRTARAKMHKARTANKGSRKILRWLVKVSSPAKRAKGSRSLVKARRAKRGRGQARMRRRLKRDRSPVKASSRARRGREGSSLVLMAKAKAKVRDSSKLLRSRSPRAINLDSSLARMGSKRAKMASSPDNLAKAKARGRANRKPLKMVSSPVKVSSQDKANNRAKGRSQGWVRVEGRRSKRRMPTWG